MKVNVLTEIIRKVVREEVKKAIRSELKKPVTEKTTSFKDLMEDEVRPTSIKKSQPKRQFTKNKQLNDILNETIGGISSGTESSEQVDNVKSDYKNLMNKEMFGTEDMGMLMNKGGQPNVAAQTVGNSGAKPTTELAGILNKDYSKVLKAMDKKAKEKRGL